MPDYVVVGQLALGEPDPNVKGAINHRHYKPGEVVDLTKEQAASYGGAVRPAEAPPAPEPTTKKG